jgi:hypothetical protein
VLVTVSSAVAPSARATGAIPSAAVIDVLFAVAAGFAVAALALVVTVVRIPGPAPALVEEDEPVAIDEGYEWSVDAA